MQTDKPLSAANCQAGNDAGSAKNVCCSGCVEPAVKMRMPVRPLLIQCFIFATASGATTSTENTPVKRSGWAATASLTYVLSNA